MILLTGASGYIGSRLLRVLEEGGCTVRCLARQPERVAPAGPAVEVVGGDCLEEASLDAAMQGVDQAYYLDSRYCVEFFRDRSSFDRLRLSR